MNKHAEAHPDTQNLVEDEQALLDATAHVAADKVMAARKRLAACIKAGKETWEVVQQRAVTGVKVTDQATANILISRWASRWGLVP